MPHQNKWSDQLSIPAELLLAYQQVYTNCNFRCTTPLAEKESSLYNAYHFQLDNKAICYRMAKITPTKTGQFVTLWKRHSTAVITPFDALDPIDFVIISVVKNERFGQFIFPKAVLLDKGIFSTATKEGKRATRVYPPWDQTSSKQAQKTQQWQLAYFYEISSNTDLNTVKKLLAPNA